LEKLQLQHLINHIAFVLDRSGSMRGLLNTVETVFDKEIEHLKMRSKELNQETRLSVYTFDSIIECLVFDMDVMRMPSLKGTLKDGGQTALLDATLQAINDMQLLPQKYGDHAFLAYVLTDGEENKSKVKVNTFVDALSRLATNWTIACMVPNSRGVHEAKKFGFPQNNISVWDTTTQGIVEVGETTYRATDNYMYARSLGIRSTSNFFSTDLSNVSNTQAKARLVELTPNEYTILRVDPKKDRVIKEFVESWMKEPYRIGQGYYELVKSESIQNNKRICIQNRQDGRVYGGQNARDMLGLPPYTLKVKPGDHGEWNIFVQSTSVNRKLPAGTSLLVMK
jgi:uncharacterized protein YegL